MELIVQSLMLLICLVASIKLSHTPRPVAWAYALLAGAFVYWTSDWAASQTRGGIAAYVDNRELREYIAILVTLESMLFVLFAFVSFRGKDGQTFKATSARHWLQMALLCYPPLLVFPVLLYAQTNLIFALPGVDFSLLSMAMAGGVLVLFVTLPYLIRLLLPEREMRLEVLFLSSLFVFVMGLITTVDDRLTYAAPEYELPWRGLMLALSLFVICFALGVLLPKLKRLITQR